MELIIFYTDLMNPMRERLSKLAFYSGTLCLLFNLSCSNNESFEILYYSNLNGNIEACDCYDTMLGGLHQIKPVVDTLKKKNPNMIVIDGGDTFNTYSFIELDQAIFDAYKILKPDIWVPGDQELIEGQQFFEGLVDSLNSSFIMGNITINNKPTENSKVYDFKKKKIFITSYIQPNIFEGMNPQPAITIKNENLLKNINPDYFNVLIFHGEELELANQENIIVNFDLLLTSHHQNSSIDLEAHPPTIGGGADGEFLVHIILQENDSGFKINASKINIEQSPKPNQQITNIISDYRNKIGLTD